jgi:hypothetical protein
MTFVASLCYDGIIAPMDLDSAMNGDVAIMDNLAAHKVDGARETIETAGASFSISRPIRPISILSKRPSLNSRRFCAPPDMMRFDRKMLSAILSATYKSGSPVPATKYIKISSL